MIESPMLEQILGEELAKQFRQSILDILSERFGLISPDLSAALSAITDDKRLRRLAVSAGSSPDLESFRRSLGP